MSTLTSISPQSLGWFAVICFVIYQLYAPKLGINTRIKEITDDFNQRIENVGERIENVEARQEKHVAVTEVIAVEEDTIDGAAVKSLFNDDDLHREEILDND
jgi:gas vesicle protein